MHQHLKLKEGVIKGISDYCPLDLFSGDLTRIHKALYSLLHSPQNNLKVYIDGDLCFTGLLVSLRVVRFSLLEGGKSSDCSFEDVRHLFDDDFAPREGCDRSFVLTE